MLDNLGIAANNRDTGALCWAIAAGPKKNAHASGENTQATLGTPRRSDRTPLIVRQDQVRDEQQSALTNQNCARAATFFPKRGE